MYYSSFYESPVGRLKLGSDGDNLVGLWTEKVRHHGRPLPEELTPREDLPLFAAVRKWLDQYFAGEKPPVAELPLAPIGGAFRQGVWEILRGIGYGEVMTYADIARKMAARLGRPSMASRAVGGAVGHNPISIIIPCHRAVGSNGSLTGFGGGIATKVKLLELEGADMSRLFVPKKGTAL